MIEEHFSSAIVSKHLFLQRTLRPIRECRVLRLQYGFVKKCDNRKEGKLVDFARVTQSLRLFHGSFQSRPDTQAKFLRIGATPGLNRSQSQDNRERVLVARCEAVGARSKLLHRSLRSGAGPVHFATFNAKTVRPGEKEMMARKSLRAYRNGLETDTKSSYSGREDAPRPIQFI